MGYDKNQSFPIYFGIIFLCSLFGIFISVFYLDQILPKGLLIEDEDSDMFIAERAQKTLKGLLDIGTRIVGSVENEVQAVEYLISSLKDVMDVVEGENLFVQDLSGNFYLDYQPYGSINAYKRLQNIVVIMGDTKGDKLKPATLINAHFDTMPKSPGGSDDGIMCAIMVEVIRKVYNDRKGTNNENILIFLFNGAEESYLQGSHAFITNQKEFNVQVDVVINLEATGSGGKELLFQAGPGKSWLLNYYKQVPHPHAQVAGEEIFQSNIIPSDTDFRIFRDFGQTVGLDMAYTRNGYRYHSEFDNDRYISLGTYQHTGDNVLELVRLFSKNGISSSEEHKPVFFDYFGLFFIYYNESAEIAINVCTIILSLALMFWAFYQFGLRFDLKSLKYIGIILGGVIGSWILAAGVVLAIGAVIDAFNKTMSWYRYHFFVFGLYSLPVIIIMSTTYILLNKYNCHEKIGLSNQSQVYLHVNRFLWTLLLITSTILRIRSSYILVFPILFTSFGFLIIQIYNQFDPIHINSNKNSRVLWISVYTIMSLIPIVFIMYLALEIFGLFIPITGRFGADTNPEFMIGMFGFLLTIFIASFYMPIINLSRDFSYVIYAKIFIWLIFFITALSAFIPYSEDIDYPQPQRYWMYHTERIIRNDRNEIILNDSGIAFPNMDRNSPKMLEEYVGDYLNNKRDLTLDCDLALYCGLAVMHTTPVEELQEYIWIPTEQPPIIKNDQKLKLTMIGKNEIEPNIIRYNFVASGTDHYNIYFSPRTGIKLERNSLINFIPTNQPKWKGRDTYFIVYVDGKARENFDFSLDFKVPKSYDGLVLDIAIAGTYYNEKVMTKTNEYKDFLGKMPKWASINAWSGTYESFVY